MNLSVFTSPKAAIANYTSRVEAMSSTSSKDSSGKVVKAQPQGRHWQVGTPLRVPALVRGWQEDQGHEFQTRLGHTVRTRARNHSKERGTGVGGGGRRERGRRGEGKESWILVEFGSLEKCS